MRPARQDARLAPCIISPPFLSPQNPPGSLTTPPPWDSKSARYIHIVSAAHTKTDPNSKPFRSTYYDDRMRASPALLRARAPYLIKNTITGFAICSLVIGICAHPLRASLIGVLTHLFQTLTPSMPSPRTSSRMSLCQTSRWTGPLSLPPKPFNKPWTRASKIIICLYIGVKDMYALGWRYRNHSGNTTFSPF